MLNHKLYLKHLWCTCIYSFGRYLCSFGSYIFLHCLLLFEWSSCVYASVVYRNLFGPWLMYEPNDDHVCAKRLYMYVPNEIDDFAWICMCQTKYVCTKRINIHYMQTNSCMCQTKSWFTNRWFSFGTYATQRSNHFETSDIVSIC